MYEYQKNFGEYLRYQMQNAIFDNEAEKNNLKMPEAKFSRVSFVPVFEHGIQEESDQLAVFVFN